MKFVVDIWKMTW